MGVYCQARAYKGCEVEGVSNYGVVGVQGGDKVVGGPFVVGLQLAEY